MLIGASWTRGGERKADKGMERSEADVVGRGL